MVSPSSISYTYHTPNVYEMLSFLYTLVTSLKSSSLFPQYAVLSLYKKSKDEYLLSSFPQNNAFLILYYYSFLFLNSLLKNTKSICPYSY